MSEVFFTTLVEEVCKILLDIYLVIALIALSYECVRYCKLHRRETR